jgi:CBS domain-containing protein
MLPDVLSPAGRPTPAAGAAQYVPEEYEADGPTIRRRAERPAGRQRPPAERRREAARVSRDRAAPAGAALTEDTPLQRVRRAMSHHQVDAILVLGRDDGAPLRWVTRDGLIRKAEREPAGNGVRQAIVDVVAHLKADTTLAQLRELVKDPDVSRVLIWTDTGPAAIVSADELLAHATAEPGASAGEAPQLHGAADSAESMTPELTGHARRLLGLVARAQPDVDGWTSEAQLESMVAGGRLEWRVQALEALTAAGLLNRVQRDGQFDYRLTPRGLELADAHRSPATSDPPQPEQQLRW